jgi:signal transduction histidine kinase
MNRIAVCCMLVLWLLLPMSVDARLITAQDDGVRPISLVDDASILCVKDPHLTLNEVAAPEMAGRFGKAEGALLRGFTPETCWLRFSLSRLPQARPKWILRIDKPFFDEVSLFAPKDGSSQALEYDEIRLGDRVPFASRPIPDRLFAFPIEIPSDQSATFYLRIRTTSTFAIEKLDLMSGEGLLRVAQRELPIYGILFGIIFLGVFSNLVFGIRLRDRTYALYTFYLAVLLVLNLANSGLMAKWIFPQHPLIADRAVGLGMSLAVFAGLAFFNQIFSVDRRLPWMRFVIPPLYAFNLVSAALAVMGLFEWVARLVNIGSLIIVLGVLAISSLLLIRGEKGLSFYLLAFIAQLFASVIGLGRNLSLPLDEIWIDEYALVATAVHVMLLNIAVADKLQKMQAETLRLERESARLALEQAAIEQEHKFMSMIAHEFRTPLAIVDTSAQRIASRYAQTDQATVERCVNIRAAVARAIRLMDEFLDTEKTSARVQRANIQTTALADIVRDISAEFSGHKVEIVLSQAPATLLCDAALLEIALGNLIRNALQHDNRDRGVKVHVSGSNHGGVRFEVIDEGQGIPESELPTVFKKFVRGSSAQSRAGLGMGLHIVSEIALAHRGTVTVRSRLGEGSVFTLELPTAASPAS